MTQFLPPNLLALFAPRDPLPFLPPVEKLPHEKNSTPYSGIAQFINQFENPKDTPPPTRVETSEEKKERKRKERAEQVAYKLEQDLALWDPSNDTNIYGDPYKTLFVARINFDSSESKLRREFDQYGPVRKVHLIMDGVSGKPRGYAFIEFEHERDMHTAYKHADGKKIDGRRVLVDVERGRTVKGWRPRRLGGGLGSTRKGGSDVNTKYSGRDDFDTRERGGIPEERERNVRESSSTKDSRGVDGYRRSRRSGSRERRRSRSRDRERRRRSRERRRSNDKDIVKKEPLDENEAPVEGEEGGRKRSRRSRSRDRRRSRSRDRKRSRRSRSRDRERRGSRGRTDRVKVKEEIPEEAGAGSEQNGANGENFVKQEVEMDGQEYGGYEASAEGQQQDYGGSGYGGGEYNYEDA